MVAMFTFQAAVIANKKNSAAEDLQEAMDEVVFLFFSYVVCCYEYSM